MEEMATTKCLGLQIDNHLNWKKHTEQMILKLSGACYAVRLMVHVSNINIHKPVHYVYFRSIIKYGIIFGGNSSNSRRVFNLQEKIVRITAGTQPRTSCRSLLKQSEILPVQWQHIFSSRNFIVSYQDIFKQTHMYTVLIQEISAIFID
jgi:hypothetical protein